MRFGPFLPSAVIALFLGALSLGGLKIPIPGWSGVYASRISLPLTGTVALPEIAGAGEGALPLIVIDPGHGGKDPGASGQGVQEKTLVLDLAKALRDRLVETQTARVALTRSDDRYLLHQERYDIARRLDADLFLSIHADSAGEREQIAGASIYVLSDEASSEAAQRFATRVNNADRVNGRLITQEDDNVSAILVELSQRRTQEQSSEFARLIEREGRGTIRFHPEAQRSAALKVLRAPDVPSVLYESGFITNEAEARSLTSARGQQQFAEAMAQAIRVYFARNPRESDPASAGS